MSEEQPEEAPPPAEEAPPPPPEEAPPPPPEEAPPPPPEETQAEPPPPPEQHPSEEPPHEEHPHEEPPPPEEPQLKQEEEAKPPEKSFSLEKKKSPAAIHKAESKSAPQTKPSVEMLKKHEPVEQKSTQDVPQQRSSKMSVSSLGKRQSREDSKDAFARKKSTRSIKNAVGSIVSFRRGSIAEYFDRQKTAKFMNTYKLESDNPFNVDKVTKILEEVLIEALENLTYDADKVPKQAKWASSAIRAKVKEQEYDRYKIICLVTIGEKRSQDMFSTYRFLWDVERDKHASFVHENMYVFAIACCFGLYYE